MSVGVPMGLLALLAVPALVGLYFFRRRSGPRYVSALFLWRSTEDLTQSGPRWQKLNREFSLLLECTAALCAVLFLADVRCSPRAGAQAHTVVVLDSSLSMRARGEGGSVAERARQLVRTRLLDTGGLATVITTGARPHILAGPALPVREVVEKLATWQPTEPSHPFEPSWSLATEVAGSDGRVVFVTDAMVQEAPKAIEVVAIGEARPNVGFTGAWRADSSTATTVRLRVANFDTAQRSISIHLADEQHHSLRDVSVDVPAGASTPVAVDLPASDVLTATLPDDALPWDNELILGPERPKTIHIHTDLPAAAASDAVKRFIAAAPDVTSEGTPDLNILAADTKTPPPWSVMIGAVTNDAHPLRAFVGPFVALKEHPLLEDVSFDGLVWPAGASPAGHALLSAGDRALLTEADGARFYLNIELSRSNLPRAAAWPVLLGNLVELRRRSLPGFARHNVAAGERVALALGEGEWKLAGPGTERVLPPGTDTLFLPAGRYSLVHDGHSLDKLFVNALDAGESDLRTRNSGHRAANSRAFESALLPMQRSSLPLLVMLLALLLDYAIAAPGRRRFAAGAA